jgi:hypothetical protein
METSKFIGAACLMCGLTWSALSQTPAGYTVTGPTQEFQCGLYRSEIDCQAHCPRLVVYTVRAEDIASPSQLERKYWTPPELATVLLESADYQQSGLHQGHIRDLGLSAGSAQWIMVNSHANLVPMTPEVNLGPWKQLAARIEDLARTYGACDCRVEISFATAPATAVLGLPRADEPYCLPQLFLVELQAGPLHDLYAIPNEKTKRQLRECLRPAQVSRLPVE